MNNVQATCLYCGLYLGLGSFTQLSVCDINLRKSGVECAWESDTSTTCIQDFPYKEPHAVLNAFIHVLQKFCKLRFNTYDFVCHTIQHHETHTQSQHTSMLS